MTRILADLPDDDIRWLDQQAEQQKKSRAAVLREAVSAYRTEGSADWIARGAGYWRDRADILDGVEYQRAIREDRTPLD